MSYFTAVFSRHSGWRLCLLLIALSVAAGSARANGRYLVRQTTNADCGPAALATLLNFYLNVPTTEAEIARLSGANQYGTTFGGLEYAADAKGVGADSFRMDIATLRLQLTSYPAPVLVRLLLPQPHFVLVIGSKGDDILIADPASGNVMMPQNSFLNRWLLPGMKEGYVFIAARPDGRTNSVRHAEILTDLQRGKQLLMQQRPAPFMRR